jgi:hypothetical protein
MPLYQLTHEALNKIPGTTMQKQGFLERQDLQRLLKENISVIGDDLFFLSEEFSPWEDSNCRIDLLAMDRGGSLVVIELKRTEDGGHMELQAVRYAAMVSALSFKQAVTEYARILNIETINAEENMVAPPENFGKTVRIILVSPNFSPELTTAVLWLNDKGLDIHCIRIRPYQLEDRTLLEIDQIIPLREAEEYTVHIREKQGEARQTAESNKDYSHYDLRVNGQTYAKLAKRNLILQVVKSAAEAGLSLETLTQIIERRRIIVVDGNISGIEFDEAAKRERENWGLAFRPDRFFMRDEDHIHVGGKTVALSNQWARTDLHLIDEIISAVPTAKISYKRAEESD